MATIAAAAEIIAAIAAAHAAFFALRAMRLSSRLTHSLASVSFGSGQIDK
jgi:hypothetical protein